MLNDFLIDLLSASCLLKRFFGEKEEPSVLLGLTTRFGKFETLT